MITDCLTRLERGNLTGVSDAVIDALARGLPLDEAERAHLFNLAATANTSERVSTGSGRSAGWAKPSRSTRNHMRPRCTHPTPELSFGSFAPVTSGAAAVSRSWPPKRSWPYSEGRHDVSSYDPYFLGPYIVCTAEGRTCLVDGQQRIITLLLLLIYLERQAVAMPKASSKAGKLSTLIMSERFGRRTFRVDVNEYAGCFNALLNGHGFQRQ